MLRVDSMACARRHVRAPGPITSAGSPARAVLLPPLHPHGRDSTWPKIDDRGERPGGDPPARSAWPRHRSTPPPRVHSPEPASVSSTRRFCARPAGVSFEATGFLAADPCADSRLGLTPCEIRNCITVSARFGQLQVAGHALAHKPRADRHIVGIAVHQNLGLLHRGQNRGDFADGLLRLRRHVPIARGNSSSLLTVTFTAFCKRVMCAWSAAISADIVRLSS